MATQINYFIEKNSKNWRTGVRTFGNVRIRNVYRGVDLNEFGDDFSPAFVTVTLPTKSIPRASPNGKLDAQRGLSVSDRVVDAVGKPLVGVNV